MNEPEPFVDIHCHLLPGIDDGASDWDTSLAMSEMAVEDGIRTIVVTPHQLGNYTENRGDAIRALTAELQQRLEQAGTALSVLPGGDVRIEPEMIDGLKSGEILTLGDHRRHVLLELPHELYFPLDGLLKELHSLGMVGILSHPERNMGILGQLKIVERLVEQGCLMQVTADSMTGSFGSAIKTFSDKLIQRGLVHFVSSDAHGLDSRRPILGDAFQRVLQLAGWQFAVEACCRFPAAVAAGRNVPQGRRPVEKRGLAAWFGWS